VRFGQLLYDDELSVLSVVPPKNVAIPTAILAFIGALLAEVALILDKLQPNSINSGSDVAYYTFAVVSFDFFSLLLAVLLFLYAILLAHLSRPATKYSNFLEPLCIAAHLRELEVGEQGRQGAVAAPEQGARVLEGGARPSGAAEHAVTVNPLHLGGAAPKAPGGAPLAAGSGIVSGAARIHLVGGKTKCLMRGRGGAAFTLEVLDRFLTSMGLETVHVDTTPNPSEPGLFVFCLETVEDVTGYLSILEEAPGFEQRAIPVVFDRDCQKGKGCLFNFLFLDASRGKEEGGYQARVGGDILKALAKRVAVALKDASDKASAAQAQ
jgi:hypothetical protein